MCGITGIFHFEKDRVVDKDILCSMTRTLVHRGPDGEGIYLKKNLGLGHRRLSIIDLETGDQPMQTHESDAILVFNGEIYNYIELRHELIELGYSFKTKSDTEVILNAYKEWGVNCQKHFNGMWAFALWDCRKQQLFLSRDRIGEKPLFYSRFDNTLIFGSELQAIFEYGVPKETRLELVEIYLLLTHIPGPDTFFKNVFKLKPGHFILADRSSVKEHKYWDLPDLDERNMISNKKEVYENFSFLYEDSVKIRMRSDVSYGAFLSGGLDSSSIVSIMARNSSQPIETFTVGFPEKDFDESEIAKSVADAFNTNHHLGTVTPDNFHESITRSVRYFGEPFGNSSAIPTWQISNFASRYVKMVLTGDGGDEVLSGYRSYSGIKFSALYSHIPDSFQKTFIQLIDALSKNIGGKYRYKLNKYSNVLRTSSLPFWERMMNKKSYIPIPFIKALTSHLKNLIPIEDYYRDVCNSIPYEDEFYKLMFINHKHDMPNSAFVKVDRMSMANSIETRTPFLDYRLMDYMVKVDKSVKMQGWERKSVLRHTVGKKLPKKLLNAPKKGFGIPLREWFKDESLITNLELTNLKRLFQEAAVDQVISRNSAGVMDNGNFIWTLIMLDSFLSGNGIEN